jgi:Spx/MgsR family transcriptional regulator
MFCILGVIVTADRCWAVRRGFLFTIKLIAGCAYIHWLGGQFDSFFRPFLAFLWQNHAMVTVYGIPNCDTVKKARVWLAAQGLAHTFHDFKKQGVPGDKLPAWAKAVGWDKLLNRQGTTWRKLDADAQANAASPQGAQKLSLDNPSIIKRPVVEWPGGVVTVGFDVQLWADLVAK